VGVWIPAQICIHTTGGVAAVSQQPLCGFSQGYRLLPCLAVQLDDAVLLVVRQIWYDQTTEYSSAVAAGTVQFSSLRVACREVSTKTGGERSMLQTLPCIVGGV